MEENLKQSDDETPQIPMSVSHVAVPHMWNTHLGDEQEKAPRHKEAQGRALHHQRAL